MPLAAEWIYRRTRMAKKKKRKAEPGDVATNRQAAFRYHLLERWECGIQLQGSEVKSLRAGAVQLKDAYAEIRDGEVWLQNMHIAYKPASSENHDPERPRILMHRREIERLIGKTAEKGLTLVPTRVYFKGSRAKVELALAKGKERHDKRRAIKIARRGARSTGPCQTGARASLGRCCASPDGNRPRSCSRRSSARFWSIRSSRTATSAGRSSASSGSGSSAWCCWQYARRRHTWVALLFGLPATGLLLIQAITTDDALLPYSSAFEAVLYFYAAGALIAYMLEDHVITRDELYAVEATFTLVAWAFAYSYTVCQAIEPDSFTAAVDAGKDRSWMELLFLSFTTLSSTGLSDVVPVKGFVRGLVMIEQVAAWATSRWSCRGSWACSSSSAPDRSVHHHALHRRRRASEP